MHRYWNAILAPLLAELTPRHVVEVGSEFGHNTKNLLAFLEGSGGRLDVIDPAPQFPYQEWREASSADFHVHRTTSLEMLPALGAADLVLLDGDHNWYTVVEELRIIGREFEEFPVVLLHDVGWPYGRRDLYYVPERIPEAMRQPIGYGGLVPGEPDQSAASGFNRGAANALTEGTPRNGVLTAIEDFVSEFATPLRLRVIPGIHGLGILCSTERARTAGPTLAALLEAPGNLLYDNGYLEVLEAERFKAVIHGLDTYHELMETVEALQSALESTTAQRDALHELLEQGPIGKILGLGRLALKRILRSRKAS